MLLELHTGGEPGSLPTPMKGEGAVRLLFSALLSVAPGSTGLGDMRWHKGDQNPAYSLQSHVLPAAHAEWDTPICGSHVLANPGGVRLLRDRQPQGCQDGRPLHCLPRPLLAED